MHRIGGRPHDHRYSIASLPLAARSRSRSRLFAATRYADDPTTTATSGPAQWAPTSGTEEESVARAKSLLQNAGRSVSGLHPQVMVTSGEGSDEVDEALAPLFERLWSAGIETVLSCQCHPPTGKVWISFASGGDAERFLAAVQDGGPADAWARAEHWYFGFYEATAGGRAPVISPPQHPAGWEFHASVHQVGTPAEPHLAIRVDILFPPEDLPRVLARVSASLSGS